MYCFAWLLIEIRACGFPTGFALVELYPVVGIDASAVFYTLNSMCTSIQLPQDAVHRRREGDDQLRVCYPLSSQVKEWIPSKV